MFVSKIVQKLVSKCSVSSLANSFFVKSIDFMNMMKGKFREVMNDFDLTKFFVATKIE